MSAPFHVSPLGSQQSDTQDTRLPHDGDVSGETSQSQSLLGHGLSDGNENAAMHAHLRNYDQNPAVRIRPSTASILSYDSLEEPPADIKDHLPEKKQKGKPKRWGWLPKSIWTSEILSCVIAAGCLAAIIGILSTHQGLPLPQWPLHITINALVSVFTAIFKMALTMPIAEGILL